MPNQRKITNKIPKKFKYLFWDVEFDELDTTEYKNFIIERLFEKGNFEAVKWVFRQYKLATIKEIIYTPLNLSKKTIYFWRLYFNYCETLQECSS